MSYLLDSGFWFALLNNDEQMHEQVLTVAQQVSGQIITVLLYLQRLLIWCDAIWGVWR